MKQKEHYTQALPHLRDFCLRHGEPTTFAAGQTIEAEGDAASLFGYIETGSFQYTVRDYHGTKQVMETAAAGDFIGHYPYCLDGDAAPTTIVATQSAIVHMVSGRQLSEHFLQSRDGVELAMHYLRYRFARLHQLRRQYYLPTDPWTNKQVPKRF